MGLIREPAEVDFTLSSTLWTAEEEKEFSELIRAQKCVRNNSSQQPTRLRSAAFAMPPQPFARQLF